jgi:hypothetical protein
MVAVVFIHTHMGNISVGGESLIQESQFPCFAAVFHLLTDVFARIAVPCFFVIAGYLFFYGIKAWNKQVYFAKLKSRVHSLLIPYVFWNVFWVVALYAGQLLFPHLLSGKNRLISDYGWQEWMDVCLALGGVTITHDRCQNGVWVSFDSYPYGCRRRLFIPCVAQNLATLYRRYYRWSIKIVTFAKR